MLVSLFVDPLSRYPPQITKMLDSLAVVNLNVIPALGLNCNFSTFDHN